jgi:hypothetical protein
MRGVKQGRKRTRSHRKEKGLDGIFWWAGLTVAVLAVSAVAVAAVAALGPRGEVGAAGVFVATCWLCTWLVVGLGRKSIIDPAFDPSRW